MPQGAEVFCADYLYYLPDGFPLAYVEQTKAGLTQPPKTAEDVSRIANPYPEEPKEVKKRAVNTDGAVK